MTIEQMKTIEEAIGRYSTMRCSLSPEKGLLKNSLLSCRDYMNDIVEEMLFVTKSHLEARQEYQAKEAKYQEHLAMAIGELDKKKYRSADERKAAARQNDEIQTMNLMVVEAQQKLHGIEALREMQRTTYNNLDKFRHDVCMLLGLEGITLREISAPAG